MAANGNRGSREESSAGGGRGRRARSPSARPSVLRRLIKFLLLWLGIPTLLGVLLLGAAVMIEAQSLPDFNDLKSSQVGQTIVVRARDGTQLFSLGPSYGRWLSYDQIPYVMKAAIISTEDRRFRLHFGVDPIGIARSLMVRAETGHWRQGGSTITQQLARNIFLNDKRTFSRKAREAMIAMALETKFSKDQILELYLNKVYFGGGAYGIDAASRKFFSHSATHLSLPEAAIIAGLVKAPSHFSPTADRQAAIERAKTVLAVMQDNGAISEADAANAHLEQVHLANETAQNSVRYFTDWALPQLDTLLPDNTEPVEVWTTLDPKLQAAATAAIQNNVPHGAQGALVSLDADGAVLAMVGGTDYVTSNYNRATLAMRQPGSSWKLFVYLAALEAGMKPGDAVIDQPVTIDGWSPRNAEGTYAGQIDVRTAFAYSLNTVAAQLGQQVGFDAVAAMARRFGITSSISTNPSMVLGTNDVRLIEMTRAYAEISARGTMVEPYGITKVVTTDGRILYQHQTLQPQTLIVPEVAAGMTDLLQTAVSIGTGRAAQIGRPVAGKTGTTSSGKDGWFLGFSSGVTTGVWMGRDDARAVQGLYGGTAPAHAFAQFMKTAVASRPIEPFQTQVTLPAWQLEPDDEANQADPNAYYYDGATDNGATVGTGSGVAGAGQGGQDQRGNGATDKGVEANGGGGGDVGAVVNGQRSSAALNGGKTPSYTPPAHRAVVRRIPSAVNEDFLNQATGNRAQ